MASTNKTINYFLSKFLGTDKLERTDYNSDMEKIDTELKKLNDADVAHQAESTEKHIAESGTNANGKYIRYDDGTQIVYSNLELIIQTDNNLLGTTWNFPANFLSNNFPSVFIFPITDNSTFSNTPIGELTGTFIYARTFDATKTLPRIVRDTPFASNDTINVYAMAIGRWK